MSTVTHVSLRCDQCAHEGSFRAGAHCEGWWTLWIYRGVPTFDLASGPRGMRDELEEIDRRLVHLCPTCVERMRVFLRSFFAQAIPSHMLEEPDAGRVVRAGAITRGPGPHQDYESDDIPF